MQSPGAFVVQVNTLDLDTISSANEYAVQSTINNLNYNSQTIDYDIGLVQLKKSIVNAVAIQIATALPVDYTDVEIIGWGLTDGVWLCHNIF